MPCWSTAGSAWGSAADNPRAALLRHRRRSRMKAAVVASPKGFEFAELESPRPGPEDVLVRVRAAALNHADLGVLAGHMHGAIGGPGTVLGMEWAGEVLEAGPAVTEFEPGDRVMGSGRGALAQQVVAHAGRVLPLPRPE